MTDTSHTTESNVVPIRPPPKPREATAEEALRFALIALCPARPKPGNKREAKACRKTVDRAIVRVADSCRERPVDAEIARVAGAYLARRCAACGACKSRRG